MSEMKPQVYFFHGFWGRTQDFHSMNSPAIDIKSVEYTQDELLAPDKPLSWWGERFDQWIKRHNVAVPLRAVGYSQGGRLLLQAFQADPHYFEKLILISSHPGLVNKEDRKQRLDQDQQKAQHFRTWDWSKLQASWNAQGVFQGGKETIRKEEDFDREILALCLENWSLGWQENFRELILQWPDKIKIILGEKDSKYVALYEEFGCSFRKIKGAAHRAPFDQSQLCLTAIESFLL